MIASELAQELRITQAAMSKAIGMYCQEAGIEKGDHRLSDELVNALREVFRRWRNGEAKTLRQAIQQLLGKINEPIPTDSARQVIKSLSVMEETLRRVESKLDELLQARQQPNIPQSGSLFE